MTFNDLDSLNAVIALILRFSANLTHFQADYVTVVEHLEYCCQVWSPHYSNDIKLLEGVQQRRTTNMINDMENLHYEERLRQLDSWANKFGNT